MKIFISKKYLIPLAFAIAFIVFRAINISMFEPTPRRNFLRGDAYSDINLYSALKYFKDSGLLSTYGLPVHYYKVQLADTNLKPIVYTHYPALPDILAFFYSKILHTDKEVYLRFVVIGISVFYAFLLFYFLNGMIKNPKIVWISWLLIIFSNYYLGWSDSLHKHVYEEFFKIIFLILLLKYAEKPKFIYGLGMFFSMFLVSNISFEPIVFIAVVCVAFSWIKYKSIFTIFTILPAVAAVLGVSAHFYQNVLYFGSIDIAIADLQETVSLRTTGIETLGELKKAEHPFGWKEAIGLPFNWLNRVERFFIIPSFGLIAMAFYAKKELKLLMDKQHRQWFWILLMASFSWCMVMAQHAYVHIFTTRHLGICYALIAGTLLVGFYNAFKLQILKKNKVAIILGTAIIAYSVAMFLSQQVWDFWIKNTFFAW